MRLAESAGFDLADGLYHLARPPGGLERRPLMMDEVPEPPGNAAGGPSLVAWLAGAGR
jgi:hypothetical protein